MSSRRDCLLQAFLNLFVDDTASHAAMSRRRSTTEDDHPPSPVAGIESSFYSNSPAAATAAAGAAASTARQFKSPLTPMSNPATPTSPANKMQVRLSGWTSSSLYVRAVKSFHYD